MLAATRVFYELSSAARVAWPADAPRECTTSARTCGVVPTLYVADTGNHAIRSIALANAAVTTVAGTGGPGVADGTGTAAQFASPYALTVSGANLYVADTGNCTIRTIVIAGAVVSTLAGTGLACGSTDATGSAARLTFPSGVASDGANLYVSDQRNTVRKIVIASGVVTTLASTAAGSDGTAALARFAAMTSANAVVTTLAGMADEPSVVDGTAAAARFQMPWGVIGAGTQLVITDAEGGTVRLLQ